MTVWTMALRVLWRPMKFLAVHGVVGALEKFPHGYGRIGR